MTTAGTLYDKEIRLGYAKLLLTASVAGMQNWTVSSALLNSTYDVYYFDFQKVRPSVAGDRLVMYVSDDNGATLKTTNYYSSHQYTVSHNGGSGVQSYPLNVVYPYFSLSLNAIDSGANIVGDVVFYRALVGGAWDAPFTWHMTTVQDATFITVHVIGGGTCINVQVNYILFTCASGNVFSDGFIRLYGCRRGV